MRTLLDKGVGVEAGVSAAAQDEHVKRYIAMSAAMVALDWKFFKYLLRPLILSIGTGTAFPTTSFSLKVWIWPSVGPWPAPSSQS